MKLFLIPILVSLILIGCVEDNKEEIPTNCTEICTTSYYPTMVGKVLIMTPMTTCDWLCIDANVTFDTGDQQCE